MDYIHVKEIEKHNPGYKDRILIWCKTYFSMINADPDFEMLCEIDKWRLIAFIMLELQIKKPVPLDKEYLIRKGFDLEKRPISLTLQMLHNFLEVRNAGVTQSRVEKSRVKKNKVEKNVKKRFIPPTFEEVKQYIAENPELSNVDAHTFWKGFNDSGWIDTRGNPVRNWKLKLRTWSNYGRTNQVVGSNRPDKPREPFIR